MISGRAATQKAFWYSISSNAYYLRNLKIALMSEFEQVQSQTHRIVALMTTLTIALATVYLTIASK